MAFPTTLDTFTDPISSDKLNTPLSHTALHVLVNQAVAALEAKAGVNGSAVVSSLDYIVNHLSLLGLADALGSAAAALVTAEAYADSGIATRQPLDSDLTAIAALATTSFGRGSLTQADAASFRSYIGAGTSSFSGAFSSLSGIPTTLAGYGITDAQPLDTDLTTLASLTATTDNFIVSVAAAWASRTPSQVRTTLSLVIGTNVQAWDADLDAIAGLASAADNLPYATGAQTWALTPFTAAGRALVDDTDAAAQRTTLGLGTLATQSGTFSGTSSGTNTGDQTVPTAANPTGTVGATAVNGTATTFLRSDGAPALSAAVIAQLKYLAFIAASLSAR